MDLENQEQVKEFVKNTVKNHQEIQFTSRNFTEEIKKITEGEEFNKLYEKAQDKIKDAVGHAIDQAFDELENKLEEKGCCIII